MYLNVFSVLRNSAPHSRCTRYTVQTKFYTIHTNTERCMVACTTKRFSHSSHSLCCKKFTRFKHGNPFGSPRSHSIWQSILTYCHILLLNTNYRNIDFKAYFNPFSLTWILEMNNHFNSNNHCFTFRSNSLLQFESYL